MASFDTLSTGMRESELMKDLRSGRIEAADLAERMPSFFFKLQIQTISYCNATCVTCPYPATQATQTMGRMSVDLFRTIADQLKGKGVERTSLFLMNEPLLDTRLEDFAAYLSAVEPETRITLITNGTLLDAKRARALAEAGVGEISVSMNGFDAASYEATMEGLSFEKLIANLSEVGASYLRGELGELELRIVALDMGNARDHAEDMRSRTGLPVYLKPVTNRAGAIDCASFEARQAPATQRKLCQRPFVKAYVLYDGTMLLCNCDWSRTTVVGDVRKQSLEEIWNGPELMACRRGLLEGPLPSLCQGCDYPYLI